MSHLRLVKPAPEANHALTYTNRMGVRYYLHEGRTKTGKPKYFFAKTTRNGALAEMPKGFGVSESINGIVSVKRRKPGEVTAPPEDVMVVEDALARHERLRWYKVRAVARAIVIYEPYPTPEALRELHESYSLLSRPASTRRYIEDRMKKATYSSVMKFERDGEGYAAYRMTYRGDGGWSWPLNTGTLQTLTKKLVPTLGTERFFELH